MAAAESTRLIKVSTRDGYELQVPKNILAFSQVVNSLLEAHDFDEERAQNAEAIPIDVEASVLRKVFLWCEHHSEDGPLGDEEKRLLTEWDRAFLDLTDSEVLELILASHYLEINCLQDAGCQTIADRLRGLSTEEIRERFNVENDFSAEEEEQIRRENSWLD